LGKWTIIPIAKYCHRNVALISNPITKRSQHEKQQRTAHVKTDKNGTCGQIQAKVYISKATATA